MKNEYEVPQHMIDDRNRRMRKRKIIVRNQYILNIIFYTLSILLALGVYFAIESMNTWTDNLMEEMRTIDGAYVV